MKRAGLHSGYYAVRVSTGIGWAFYADNRLARMRASAEGHGRVCWMDTATADHFIERGATVA